MLSKIYFYEKKIQCAECYPRYISLKKKIQCAEKFVLWAIISVNEGNNVFICVCIKYLWISSVQLLSHVQLFATPWTAARQASLSITNTWSQPKPMSMESVMPPNHLILLSSPSPPALNLSQYQSLFKCVSSSHQVAKVLELQLQHQSFQWTPRTDLL